MNHTEIPRIIRRREAVYVVTRDCDCACVDNLFANKKQSIGDFLLPDMVQHVHRHEYRHRPCRR